MKKIIIILLFALAGCTNSEVAVHVVENEFIEDILVIDEEEALLGGYSTSYGAATRISGSGTFYVAKTAMVDSDTIIVGFIDSANDDYVAVVAEVSGTTISTGSPYVVYNDAFSYMGICLADSNTFVMAYADDTNLDDGYAIACDFSGTTISGCGSAFEFDNADSEHIDCVQVDTNKVIIGYDDEANSDTGAAVACSVSGTTVSCGTPVDFDSSCDYYPQDMACVKSDTNKFACAFRSTDSSADRCGYDAQIVAGSVSGTTVSMGTPEYLSASSTSSGIGPRINFFSATDYCVYANYDASSNPQYLFCGTLSSNTLNTNTTTPTKLSKYAQGSAYITPLTTTTGLFSYRDGLTSPYPGESRYFTANFTSDIVTSYENYTTFNSDVGANTITSGLLSSNKVYICYTRYNPDVTTDRGAWCEIATISETAAAVSNSDSGTYIFD